MKTDSIKLMNQCAIWLIKNLCLDTNAEEATITQRGVYHKDKVFGDYEITIKKLK